MKKLLLIFICVSTYSQEPYNRDEYKWIDEDQDGLNTRMEVLIEENIGKLVISRRRVVSGRWYDPYSDEYFTNASDLDVDHFVPLKEAYLSGAFAWDKDLKSKYGNYLGNPNHLIAVSKFENRSKGSKTPCSWMPTNIKYHEEYVDTWISIKNEWGLEIDRDEKICIFFIRIKVFFYNLFFR